MYHRYYTYRYATKFVKRFEKGEIFPRLYLRADHDYLYTGKGEFFFRKSCIIYHAF